MYDEPPVIAKNRAEDEIRYAFAQTLADAVQSRMTVRRTDDVHLRVTHFSGSINMLVMTVDEFHLAADMENEARAIELQQLREENQRLRGELHKYRTKTPTFNEPKC